MFITAFVLVSTIVASSPQATSAADPASSAATKAEAKVTEADRKQMRAILAALDKTEAELKRRFDRHEMTKGDLAQLRDLTMRIVQVSPIRNCLPSCEAGMICCNGLCIDIGTGCTHPLPPCDDEPRSPVK